MQRVVWAQSRGAGVADDLESVDVMVLGDVAARGRRCDADVDGGAASEDGVNLSKSAGADFEVLERQLDGIKVDDGEGVGKAVARLGFALIVLSWIHAAWCSTGDLSRVVVEDGRESENVGFGYGAFHVEDEEGLCAVSGPCCNHWPGWGQ